MSLAARQRKGPVVDVDVVFVRGGATYSTQLCVLAAA